MINVTKRMVLAAALVFPVVAWTNDRFIGEVFFVGESYCPVGSVLANGQTFPVEGNGNKYSTMFPVIGFRFGGDGSTTFAVPNLTGLSVVGAGNNVLSGENYMVGQTSYNDSYDVSGTACPPHQHTMFGTVTVGDSSATADHESPAGRTLALSANKAYSATNSCASNMAADAITLSGKSDKNVTNGSSGSEPTISTVNPYLAMTPCIAYSGQFPNRN